MPVTHGRALQPKIEQFLTYCGALNLSQNTIRAYRPDLKEFIALVGREAKTSQINRKLLRRFITQLYERGIARTSIVRKFAAVKSFCQWLGTQGLLEWEMVQPMSPRRRNANLPDVPTVAEVEKFLNGPIDTASPERDRLILELLYGSGLRAAEVTHINLEDFQDKDVLLVKGKGRKERKVIVSEPAQAALTAWLPVRLALLEKQQLTTPAMFFSVGPHQSIERLDVRSIGRIVKAIAKTRGFDPKKWHPHTFRHACGTHMHDHGAPLQAVAQLLGHAKLSTAQIYTRVSVGRMMNTYNAAHPHAKAA